METEVIISTGAAKYFKKLKDKRLKEKFAEAIKKIKENPEIGEMKKSDLAGIYGYDIFYNKSGRRNLL